MKTTSLTCRIVSGMFVILVVVIFNAGCASNADLPPSQHTLLTRELEPSEGSALVYFYYEKLSVKPTEVALNGAVSEIGRNSYVVWEIEPGTYPLTFTFRGGTFLTEEIATTITCEAGQTYYFRLAGHDKETHDIVRVDAETGQEKIGEFDLINWFRDGELVEERAE